MASGFITVYPDSPDSYSVEVEEGQVLPIGRKPAAEGQEKLVIAVPEVSAQHAEIKATAEGWTIQDSGSTNGTQLNGDWLAPGREYALSSGDRIKIAQIDLMITLPEGVPGRQEEELVEDRTYFRINLINATILVGDIKGFTTLMEQYAAQPEVVMQSAHRVFQALSKEIFSNQGQVEKIAGDAIMAYWQESESRSASHAYQACVTALRLRDLVNSVLAKDVSCWPFTNHRLYLDMALATGPAAAGALGHKEANPALLGDTANMAFRIEKLIPEDQPGEIVVDGTTFALVKGQFNFASLGEFNVKGRQKAVDLYRLLDVKRPEIK